MISIHVRMWFWKFDTVYGSILIYSLIHSPTVLLLTQRTTETYFHIIPNSKTTHVYTFDNRIWCSITNLCSNSKRINCRSHSVVIFVETRKFTIAIYKIMKENYHIIKSRLHIRLLYWILQYQNNATVIVHNKAKYYN